MKVNPLEAIMTEEQLDLKIEFDRQLFWQLIFLLERKGILAVNDVSLLEGISTFNIRDIDDNDGKKIYFEKIEKSKKSLMESYPNNF